MARLGKSRDPTLPADKNDVQAGDNDMLTYLMFCLKTQ